MTPGNVGIEPATERRLCRRAIASVTLLWGIAVLLVLTISPQLSMAQTETVLYSFAGGTDGIGPRGGLVRDFKGNLYGTTQSGGAFGFGTVYEITAAGAEKILHSFNGTDGNSPYGSLVLAGTNLYGTTYAGGTNSLGVVYQVTLKGIFKVLYNFAGTDGSNPFAGLVRDPKTGNLYGTTGTGGAFNAGTVFELTPTRTETVLYSFNVGPGGYSPVAPLVRDPNTGNLYGTTYNGGASNYCIGGCGTVFELTPTGTETVLHSFSGPPDGWTPQSGLVRDGKGNLYGQTYLGGPGGRGIVFEVTPAGKETVLHGFTGGADGGIPVGGVLARDPKTGNLYGTTGLGGTYDYGVVFELTPSGTETVLYTFTGGNDGGDPFSNVIRDATTGNLYGTADGGGTTNSGVVFKVVP